MKIKLDSVLQYIFVWALILQCRSVFMSTEIIPGFRTLIFVVLACTVIFSLITKRQCRKKSIISAICIIGIITFIVGLYYFATRMGLMDILNLLAALAFLLMYYKVYCEEKALDQILEKYVNSMVVISLVSILFFIFGSCLHVLQPTGQYFSSWTNRNINGYGVFYFEVQQGTSLMRVLGLGDGYRNTGIFNEAPMYSFHLTLATMIQFFIRHDYDKKKLVPLIIALITSFSTTGYVMMIVMVTLNLLMKRGKTPLSVLLKIIIFPLIIYLAWDVVSLLLIDKLSDKSGLIRLDDMRAWIQLWKKNPIFGAGYGTDDYISYLASWRSGNVGTSNSVAMILGYGGIWMLMLYVVPCILCIYNAFKKRCFDSICFTVLFLLMFLITIVPFQYLTFFVFIIMSNNFYDLDKVKRTFNEDARLHLKSKPIEKSTMKI